MQTSWKIVLFMSCHEGTNEVLKSVSLLVLFADLQRDELFSRVTSFVFFTPNKRSFSHVIIIGRRVSSSCVPLAARRPRPPPRRTHCGKSKWCSKILVEAASANGVRSFASNIWRQDNTWQLKSITIRRSMRHDRNYAVHLGHRSSHSFPFHTVTISRRSSNSIQRRLRATKRPWLGAPTFVYNTSARVRGSTRPTSSWIPMTTT